MISRRQRARAAAATIVALLEDGEKTKATLQTELGLDAWTFGRAIAEARFHGYVGIRTGGIVYLTVKGRDALNPEPAAA